MSRMDDKKLKLWGDEAPNFWEELGLPPPRYEDERHAPPVDKEALRALVERRLPEDEVRELYRLTFRFRSWAEALAELRAVSLRKAPPDSKEPLG